jgi:hypothetical protein
MEVSITRVLDEINTPTDGNQAREFSIGWIRTTRGPKQGTLKKVNRCIKAGTDKRKNVEGKANKLQPMIKKRKLLRLYDRDANQTINVPLYTIIIYNGYRVRH